MREQVADPAGKRALALLMRYILLVSMEPTEALLDEIQRIVGPEVAEVVKSTGQTLIDEGIEQGIEKGIEQGIEKGIEKGARALLERQLRTKFGELSPDAQARLEAAPRADLEQWADRVLTAATLDEVFSAP
jgi:flagellar biosynthesis/type III secretory pathway protein FliH